MRKSTFVLAAVSLGASASITLAQHATDVWPAISGSNMAISPNGLVPGSHYNPLFPVNTFLQGWSANDPGFDHESSPAGDTSPMPQGVQVWLEVVAFDPALFVIDNAFHVLSSPGDQTYLGVYNLHTHDTWFVDSADPGFDPDKCVYEGTGRLIDTGIGYGPSPPFTFLFATVPVRGGEFPPTNTPASGDFDEDFDVDRVDYKAFNLCMNGPGIRPSPNDPAITTCEVDCFNAFDFNDSMSIDLFDYAELQNAFTGE